MITVVFLEITRYVGNKEGEREQVYPVVSFYRCMDPCVCPSFICIRSVCPSLGCHVYLNYGLPACEQTSVQAMVFFVVKLL